MPFEGGFTFANFLADALAIFFFVVWFWLLVVVFGDLFRRHDISGWAKALWVIGLVLFPYLGVFAYMITQSAGMAERDAQRAQHVRSELQRVAGFSVADELIKLDQLRASGSITSAEYARLRGRLV
jgi:hypothetical protein